LPLEAVQLSRAKAGTTYGAAPAGGDELSKISVGGFAPEPPGLSHCAESGSSANRSLREVSNNKGMNRVSGQRALRLLPSRALSSRLTEASLIDRTGESTH
jgi:hypothetical protein